MIKRTQDKIKTKRKKITGKNKKITGGLAPTPTAGDTITSGGRTYTTPNPHVGN